MVNFQVKGKHYIQFECKPKLKQPARIVKKQLFSSYFQLKSGHGYFKSYLNREKLTLFFYSYHHATGYCFCNI